MSTTVAEAKQRLIERVRELAYLHSPDDLFTLASGRQSPHFFDMKPVMMNPECAHLIGVLLHAEIGSLGGIDAVGGLELGAVPLAGIAIAKAERGSNLRGFMVRKEAKGRGGRKTGNPPGIEGSTLNSGDRVVLLEDVTTTGGSALKAAVRLTEMGCEVAACITILDREEGGQDAFDSAGITLVPLIVRSDVTGE
ncbi:orotate phosphoribosyltransferase [Candidatus Poseidoniales archaeon]|jgi:orotate phosphoribosyltransferase|nr:orotate phosphoribosyltransferase [Candidatus Poseidoniales archaeon]MDC0149811.1 orotate phosphoribosyltransferase [Candidatus Poseidoniales archaeon]RCH70944.1 MAG: orotate phosphoribosyltransferase [Candidatus Poseidoniales archaeon]|tara:strand:+ start:2813 stop:3397 length:585 start_codon:yes stop_codon:yes gene_type:complete